MIRWLESLTRADMPALGGKAAQLGELAAAGFPVPPGFVIGPEAYDAFVASVPNLAAWLATADTRPDDEVERVVTEQFLGRPVPADVESAVRAAYAELATRTGQATPPVAVRSSARGEDSAEASYAGQQLTYLNAVGPDLVLACLRGCWAGLWSARASAYRRRLATGGPPAMAVLVQALILPEVAGVAFTVNPVTGERDELIIDASWGLGEVVVSGRATPDHIRVEKATGRVRSYGVGEKQTEVVPDPAGVAERPTEPARRTRRALPPEALESLLALARQVEAHYGTPQDLEWAWLDGRAYLLQARPITALPPPPPPGGWVGPEPDVLWERRNFAEHLPGPVSTLAGSLVLPAVGRAVSALARSIGYTLREPTFVTIHGHAYARGSMTPRWDRWGRSAWVYGRLFARPASAWQLAGPHRRRVAPYLERPPAPDDLPAIARWCEGLVAEFARTWGDVHRLSAGWRLTEYWLVLLAGPGASAPLLQGFDAPALALEREARRLALAATPEVAAALAAPDPLAALAALGPAAEAFRADLARLEALGLGLPASFDPADPLPFEDPAAACRLVAMRLAHPGEDPAARLAAAAEASRQAEAALLAAASPRNRALLKLVIPRARAFAALREPALAELGHGWLALRRQLLALGEGLARRGGLAAAEEVFDLAWPEALALAAGSSGPAAALLAERRAARQEAAGYSPPLVIGGEPERVRAKAIAGAAASPGRVTGIARVVRGPAEFETLLPGEILVAPATTPAWTPLFHRAAAVVTDVGGPLSHGSIVAREFRIPAVLGTATATSRLRSGETITVDGDQGLVWRGG